MRRDRIGSWIDEKIDHADGALPDVSRRVVKNNADEVSSRDVLVRISIDINTGSTSKSVNFPQVKLPVLENAHRLMHIHHNIPGILAAIDNVLAEHNINIVGQYLKTNNEIGYVITDINKKYPKDVLKDLKKIKGTVRVRVLY